MSGRVLRRPICPDLVRSRFTYRDGHLYWKETANKTFNAKFAGKIALGGLKPGGYRHIALNNIQYLYHRIVWVYFNGEIPEGFSIDHIDGDPTNNDLSNLRLVTSEQNVLNKVAQYNNGQGVKNVHAGNGKYVVRVSKNGKVYRFGSYDDLTTAKEVAVVARIKLHGDYARVTEYGPDEIVHLMQKYKDLSHEAPRVRCDSRSGIKGVMYDTTRQKWIASVKINGKQYRKRFPTMEEAKNAVIQQRALLSHKEGIAA